MKLWITFIPHITTVFSPGTNHSSRRLSFSDEAVYSQGAPLSNCFGFVDGTVRGIARPGHNQRVMYNGHKRVHSVKFQSVVIPNGLIANLSGPFEGKRHDSTMLYESGLLNDLRCVAVYNGEPLCICGDPAYPFGIHLQDPYRNPNMPEKALYNEAMSGVRVAVEWLYGNITEYFKFIDFETNETKSECNRQNVYCLWFTAECPHLPLNGNLTSSKFDLQPPSLEEYFR